MVMKHIPVIGFDPSLTHWGWVKAHAKLDGTFEVVDMGIIETNNEDTKKGVRLESDNLKRSKELYEGMVEVCDGQAMAITELPLFNSYIKGAQGLARSGIVVGILGACPIPIIQVFPKNVKMLAVGSKNADKTEIVDWAVRKFPDAPWRYRTLRGKQVLKNDNEHIADAVAIINAGLQTEQFKQAMALYKSLYKPIA